ncbi:isochorismatase family protein [Corynebacterium terpenotabidum]|uniref:Enterobactin isochorismatase n=1 Tax=Corynebacterium terpenotabidum Y-11 TaxID=1200352 RepID=S4XFD9_9CORY|nr:isochorismatase family protein [Corynebacterium terpenotabidum]AGP31266.1 enterobactin isochorismatase [Corynebacterium terpenotabidum Y-11]
MATDLPASITYRMPTAWPDPVVDWTPDPGRSALLIHDMQRHFLKPFDPAEEPMTTLVPNTVALAARAREVGIPVFYTAQPSDQPLEKRALLNDYWGPGLTGDAYGAEIIDELTPADGDRVLTKWRYSAYAYTDLADRLVALGRDQLVISGVYASIGCSVTAVESFMCGVQPFLVADALGDFTATEHRLALQWTGRRAGVVLDTATVLGHWS